MNYPERLEERLALTALGLFTNDTPDPVTLEDGQVTIQGDEGRNIVRVADAKRDIKVTYTGDYVASSGFEDLAGDGSDVTEFAVGQSGLAANFEGGAAGTRGFAPGYNTDAFAFITAGESTVTMDRPANVSFAIRDIIELGDVIPGFENVQGTVTLFGLDGTVSLEVTENGDPQAGNWDRITSEDLGIGLVTQIQISNADANGDPTGVTNMDDFEMRVPEIKQRFEFLRRDVDTVFADLGGGDDYYNGARCRVNQIVNGGEGNDRMIGGRGDDTLDGGAGNDRIQGRGGDDTITGGSGRDILLGGNGEDLILAVDGERDLIRGGRGLDRIFADPEDLIGRRFRRLC